MSSSSGQSRSIVSSPPSLFSEISTTPSNCPHILLRSVILHVNAVPTALITLINHHSTASPFHRSISIISVFVLRVVHAVCGYKTDITETLEKANSEKEKA
jgi:hypothetical protein